jgi:uncharacterized protein
MGLPTFQPPTHDVISAPFWTAIAEGRIELPRCSDCGKWQWYPDDLGADCEGATLVWEPVAETGVVYAATRVVRAFLPGGRDDVPFVVGFVELDGVEGVRLVSNLIDNGTVSIGSRVRASFIETSAGHHLVFIAE